MSTRAVYTFKDSDNYVNEFHVYKHHDGYPSGAVQWIENALGYAWKLPRFEPDEFAAAFIAANKEPNHGSLHGGGGVYCTTHWKDHGDLEFRYEITAKDNDLIVTAFDYYGNGQIFTGTLDQFKEFVKQDKES